MKTLNLNNIKSFVVISDVHLRDANSPLAKLFIGEINKINNVDAVFLLGDVFDFIANSLGDIAGLLLYNWIERIFLSKLIK